MYVNGFKFHIADFGAHKTTYNSGVCVKGGNDDDDLHDYYGVLLEIIELTYSVVPELKTFLFKCEWFDSRKDVGVRRIHKDYPLIEINHKRKYQGYDPFVLATQATQVYYVPYPAMNNSKSDWWAVVKTKPRWSFNSNMIRNDDQPYQSDLDLDELLQITEGNEDVGSLNNEIFDGVELNEDDVEVEYNVEVEDDVEAEDDVEVDEDEDNSVNNESDDDNVDW